MKWLLLLSLVWPAAHAGKRKRKEEVDDTVTPSAPVVPEAPPVLGLFEPLTLLDVGAAPSGLANLSAQGCAACHPDTTHRWRQGPHGATPSEAFRSAVADQGNPSCGVCHWPMQAQQPLSFAPSLATVPAVAPSEGFDATLWTESVTCVACHLRDDAVISASPGPHDAPHPTRYSPELSEGTACAGCHQLEIDGIALYDTVGEWDRSPYAASGIGCLDCHGRRGPDGRSLADHGMVAEGAQGLSVLVSMDRRTITRGGEPLVVTVTLQNTGAGHHVPSGGPWSGLRLSAALVGVDDEGETVRVAELSHDLVRRFDEAWNVIEDTRIAAASSEALTWSPALDQDAPAGPWQVEVRLLPTARGVVSGDAVHRTLVPLQSD